jgi:hypothetical protein
VGTLSIAVMRCNGGFPVEMLHARNAPVLSRKLGGTRRALSLFLEDSRHPRLASRSAPGSSFHLISFSTRRTDHRAAMNCMSIKTPSRCPPPFLRQTHIFKRGGVVPTKGLDDASDIALRSIG